MLYLPDIINYKEAKENITTRSELNRLINSLRRFNKEGAKMKTSRGIYLDLKESEYSFSFSRFNFLFFK